jgi:hypothetical protein
MTSTQKWLLGLATSVLALTAGVYALFKYLGAALSIRFPALFPAPDDAFSAVQHPLQPWALDLHILAAPVLVFGIGWIFKDHVVAKLASKSAPLRASGIASLALIAPMVVSGYLLQMVAHEGWRLGLVLVHAVSGGLFTLVYAFHVLSAPAQERERDRWRLTRKGSIGAAGIAGSERDERSARPAGQSWSSASTPQFLVTRPIFPPLERSARAAETTPSSSKG